MLKQPIWVQKTSLKMKAAGSSHMLVPLLILTLPQPQKQKSSSFPSPPPPPPPPQQHPQISYEKMVWHILSFKILKNVQSKDFQNFSLNFIYTGVPLATEPGISLIILTSMKILQLNRHTLQTHTSSFLTQWTYSCSNFVAISSLVLELLKKCRVR
jgi:hypothetical protein